jgi:hypothetical protein
LLEAISSIQLQVSEISIEAHAKLAGAQHSCFSFILPRLTRLLIVPD